VWQAVPFISKIKIVLKQHREKETVVVEITIKEKFFFKYECAINVFLYPFSYYV